MAAFVCGGLERATEEIVGLLLEGVLGRRLLPHWHWRFALWLEIVPLVITALGGIQPIEERECTADVEGLVSQLLGHGGAREKLPALVVIGGVGVALLPVQAPEFSGRALASSRECFCQVFAWPFAMSVH